MSVVPPNNPIIVPEYPRFDSITDHAKYALNRLWEVIYIFITTCGNTVKIAQIFKTKILDAQLPIYDAALEASWLTDYQIKAFALDYSTRTIVILQVAAGLTELDYKKEAFTKLKDTLVAAHDEQVARDTLATQLEAAARATQAAQARLAQEETQRAAEARRKAEAERVARQAAQDAERVAEQRRREVAARNAEALKRAQEEQARRAEQAKEAALTARILETVLAQFADRTAPQALEAQRKLDEARATAQRTEQAARDAAQQTEAAQLAAQQAAGQAQQSAVEAQAAAQAAQDARIAAQMQQRQSPAQDRPGAAAGVDRSSSPDSVGSFADSDIDQDIDMQGGGVPTGRVPRHLIDKALNSVAKEQTALRELNDTVQIEWPSGPGRLTKDNCAALFAEHPLNRSHLQIVAGLFDNAKPAKAKIVFGTLSAWQQKTLLRYATKHVDDFVAITADYFTEIPPEGSLSARKMKRVFKTELGQLLQSDQETASARQNYQKLFDALPKRQVVRAAAAAPAAAAAVAVAGGPSV